MPIDIANMVVNMGEKTNTFGWITPATTLIAAFFGAWFAFFFNNKAQNQKEKAIQTTKLKYLTISSFSLLDYICNLINLIDRNIDITENRLDENLTIFECVNIEFDVKPSDYDFTSSYPVLLDDLNVLSINLKMLTNSLINTDKYIYCNIKDSTKDKISNLNKRLNDLKTMTLNIILNIDALKTSIQGYSEEYFKMNKIPAREFSGLEKKYLAQALSLKQQEDYNAD